MEKEKELLALVHTYVRGPMTTNAYDKFNQYLQWSMKFVFSWEFTKDMPKGKEVVKYELHIQELAKMVIYKIELDSSTNIIIFMHHVAHK